MKVSLVSTVKDAGEHIGEFLESIRVQTMRPDEIVIVDGGSTDGTLEILREADDVALLEAPDANIARGRNLAIEAATHDLIAVSDADCVLSPGWLDHLVRAIEMGADVAMGATRPIATSFFETCAAALAIPDPGEIDGSTYMPSSRSIALRREAFEQAGRYPTWLDVGEDMYLDHRLRDLYAEMVFVPEALAYWRMRPTVGATVRQYFGYARGDALGGLYPERHALRFVVYGLVGYGAARRNRWVLGAAGAAAAAWASRRVRRAFRMLPGPVERVAAAGAVPALLGLTDAAKMAGYATGLVQRARRGPR